MAKNVELLLVENVENTGIVGDVVKVRKGFARNYLLPRKLATTPSAELVKQLAGKRADAERMLAEQRKEREALIQRLAGFELSMIRSCNDQGILYGAVTQHEIATALDAAGFKGIKDREVRIGGSIKRVDSYPITVKFNSELQTEIRLKIQADRPLEIKKSDELSAEFKAAVEAEGATPSEKRQKDKSARADQGGEAKAPAAEPEAKESKKADKAEKAPKAEKAAKGDKAKK